MSCALRPKWHGAHKHSHLRANAALHILWNCVGITPTCLRRAAFGIVIDRRSHRDELLMAATWHCHAVFSMTVASVSAFACVVHTWSPWRAKRHMTNETFFLFFFFWCGFGSKPTSECNRDCSSCNEGQSRAEVGGEVAR